RRRRTVHEHNDVVVAKRRHAVRHLRADGELDAGIHGVAVVVLRRDLHVARGDGHREPEEEGTTDEQCTRHGTAPVHSSFFPRSVTRSRNVLISRLRKSTSAGNTPPAAAWPVTRPGLIVTTRTSRM